MKAIHIFFIFSIFSFNAIFAEEEPNLDDPKVQDQIIEIAAQKLEGRTKGNGYILRYLPFRQVPYTGWHAVFYENGQVEELSQYKDGKQDGLLTEWYKNGQKQYEKNYNDGKIISAEAWKPNGEKCPITNLVDGNGAIVIYREDGFATFRRTYKDRKLVQLVVYQENGSFSRITIKDGKEVKTEYYDKDGTFLFEADRGGKYIED